MSTDAEHLLWIANRLDNVHGDPPLADFIQRLREIAERLDQAGDGLAAQFMDAIVAERHRAHAKHGATSMEQSDLLSHRRASILAEEAVECGKALNDHEHGDINLRDGRSNPAAPDLVDPLDRELIQTGAMAYTWWANRRGDRLPAAEPAPERPTTWEEGECPVRVGWHHAAHHVTKDCVRSRTLDASMAEPASPPVPKAPTIPVLINGTPYTGTLDPATGTLHVHTIDGPFGKALLEPPADASWLRFENTRGRPYPPITEPDGGRRGD